MAAPLNEYGISDRGTTVGTRYSEQTWTQGDSGSMSSRVTWPERILIVDDDMGLADSLELMLHASGYSETRVAYSGAAALLIASDFQPGVVLVDLSLLDMTGYELAASLRDQAQSQRLRLIAVTSSPEHVAREEARVAGFERYLVKPVASLDLLSLMEKPSQ
jgi:DNA-binding response OmpR family regulator